MRFTLNSKNNDTSAILDFLRFFAAQLVCVGHAISFFGIFENLQPPYAPYMQNIGVIIFFVLSGFLIAYALSRYKDQEAGLAEFVVGRVARIYSAYLPALLLIAITDGFLLGIGRYEYGSSLTWPALVGNVFMMQKYTGPLSQYLAVPIFGSASQLWTLAAEFHIYVFVGALYFMFIKRNFWWSLLVAILAMPVPIHFLRTDESVTGSGLFILWCFGFATYFVAQANFWKSIQTKLLVGVFILLTFWWLHEIRPGYEYYARSYPLVAIIFGLIVVTTQRSNLAAKYEKLSSIIQCCAGYSFSLYLLHYSIIYFVKVWWPYSNWAGLLFSLLLANVVAFIFAYFTEFKHKQLASFIQSKIFVAKKVSV